jgi:hypothetical protein
MEPTLLEVKAQLALHSEEQKAGIIKLLHMISQQTLSESQYIVGPLMGICKVSSNLDPVPAAKRPLSKWVAFRSE